MSLCIGDFDHLWHDVLEMNLPSLWFFWQVLQATEWSEASVRIRSGTFWGF